MAGVTPEGFVRIRLPQIRAAIFDELRERLRNAGLPDDIDTRPDTLTGLLVDTFAEREAALWELAEGVYYGMYPDTAAGVQLDHAVSFTGVSRRQAEYSQVVLTVFGGPGTTIPAGSRVRNSINQSVWETLSDVTISPAFAKRVIVVPTAVDNFTYTITINGTDYSTTSDASATVAEILGGLVAAFSGTTFNIDNDGAALTITEDTARSMAVSLSDNLTFGLVGTAVEAQPLRKGPVEAEPGTLDTIVTTVPGWDSVTNLTAAAVGLNAEKDEELRARYDEGVYGLGAATLPSFVPNIKADVSGVTAVKVFQNTTNTVGPNGLLPHSVHLVVQGGLPQAIAESLYHIVAGGIATNGDIAVTLDTDEGSQTLRFDRPEPVYIWIKVTVTLLPDTEGQPFPSDGYGRIRNNILDFVSGYTIGEDLVYQELYCPIYEVPGIKSIDLQIASSTNAAFEPGPGDWTTTNVDINNSQLAVFDRSRVMVA